MSVKDGHMDQLSIATRYFDWFLDRIMEQEGSNEIECAGHPDWTARQTVRTYMVWAVSMGFLHVFGDDPEKPFAGIIWRPIESDKLDKYRMDYWRTVCQFDPNGDVAGVAWYHSKTGKLHLMQLDKMPIGFMLKGGY